MILLIVYRCENARKLNSPPSPDTSFFVAVCAQTLSSPLLASIKIKCVRWSNGPTIAHIMAQMPIHIESNNSNRTIQWCSASRFACVCGLCIATSPLCRPIGFCTLNWSFPLVDTWLMSNIWNRKETLLNTDVKWRNGCQIDAVYQSLAVFVCVREREKTVKGKGSLVL